MNAVPPQPTEPEPVPASLHAAREARRQGRLADARANYQRCLELGQPVAAEYAQFLHAAGDATQALTVLDQALARSPQAAGPRFARAQLQTALGRPEAAVPDYDALLASQPDLVPALFHRGSVLFQLEKLDAAAADFIRVAELKADAFDALVNAGVIRLRQQRREEALQLLNRAAVIAPDNPHVLHKLAGAMHAGTEALQLYARIEALLPEDPGVLTDHGLCLLNCGQAAAARRRFARAFNQAPSDQTALAGLYMAAIADNEAEVARQLMDYPRLLWVGEAPDPGQLDARALRQAVLDHPGLRWEPAGRSTRNGQQSTMLDMAADGPFGQFGRMLENVVRKRLAGLAVDTSLAGHPWMRAYPRRWKLQAWATVLYRGGNQSAHIHPAGWMSGVFYLDMGQPQSAAAGHLVFGHPPDDVHIHAKPLEHVLRPGSGQIACFPSYFLHHTTPYDGPGEPRISLAFDVIPLPP